jgi:hypothetical protein
MADALDELEHINPSFWNRVCYWVVALAGLIIAVDFVLALNDGRGFEFIRHTSGFLAIVWVSLTYARLVRRVTPLLARVCVEMIDRHAPASWSVETKLAFAADLPYEKLARTFALWGSRALTRRLGKELVARLGASRT